jgi:hypothetical protein
MALTKVTKGGITDDAVDGDKLKDGSITTAKIGASAVESSEINDGTVTADDLVSSLDISSKTVTLPNTSVTAGMLSNTLDLSPKSVTLSNTTIENLKRPVQDNIALLGFKMAVNDGLTVFNLVDGVVDEFHDESGTDEAEGSNDHYCATNDVYSNKIGSTPYSAGFSATAITESDTSVTQTNPAFGEGTFGTFTVPTGVTSLEFHLWGSGGGVEQAGPGGGGGFTSGDLAVTAGQVLEVVVGEGGYEEGTPSSERSLGGGGSNTTGSPYDIAAPGGGLTGLFTNCEGFPALQSNAPKAPQVFSVAGGGGGAGFTQPHSGGGAAGGTTGNVGGNVAELAQTASRNTSGGGGDQEQGGQSASPDANRDGGFLRGGLGGSTDAFNAAGGGAGYYGGAGGFFTPNSCAGGGGGGGGSSYTGHPQITNASNEGGGALGEPQVNNGFNFYSGGRASPHYPVTSNAGKGWQNDCGPEGAGNDGYILLLATSQTFAAPGGGSSTIISNAFTATSVPSTSRIVVFQENVDTPTLNTDIIASISRDGGSTFTNATLSDSGYVTGSSGQRILTGTATISGQPSGQSMRWKLALANETVKVHGVALQWS